MPKFNKTVGELSFDELVDSIYNQTLEAYINGAPLRQTVKTICVATLEWNNAKFQSEKIKIAGKPDGICMTDNCSRPVRTRGLCQSCYQVACRLIKDGKTTWSQLEIAGKCISPASYVTGKVQRFFMK